MKIIIDTCSWSLALRRNESQSNEYVEELKEFHLEAGLCQVHAAVGALKVTLLHIW